MSNIEVSDEDRDKLVKLRYRELLDDAFEDPRLIEVLHTKLTEHAKSTRSPRQTGQRSTTDTSDTGGTGESSSAGNSSKPSGKYNLLQYALGMVPR